jgi:hypothetical protein
LLLSPLLLLTSQHGSFTQHFFSHNNARHDSAMRADFEENCNEFRKNNGSAIQAIGGELNILCISRGDCFAIGPCAD